MQNDDDDRNKKKTARVGPSQEAIKTAFAGAMAEARSEHDSYIKVYEAMFDLPGAMPDVPALRAIYREWPMYRLYQNKETKMPYRAYGAALAGRERRLLVAFPAGRDVGFRIGGVPVSDVERVERWSDAQMQRIVACQCWELFVHPMGWARIGVMALDHKNAQEAAGIPETTCEAPGHGQRRHCPRCGNRSPS